MAFLISDTNRLVRLVGCAHFAGNAEWFARNGDVLKGGNVGISFFFSSWNYIVNEFLIVVMMLFYIV